MKQFYVIGNPVKHSLSPKIFDYFFKDLVIAANYNTKLIKNEDDFFKFIEKSKNYVSGYNITSPFKQMAYNIVDKFDKTAERNCSVNCIKVENKKLIGYNTDEYGFSKMIDCNNISLNKKNILILGYGKAAEIVVSHILQNTKSTIFINGRNNNKIKSFIYKFENNNIRMLGNSYTNIDIIVNCLSTQISSNNFLNLLSQVSNSKVDMFIDLNYIKINLEKIFVNQYISGIDMLILQAQKSFNIWFNNEYQNRINYLDIKKAIQ
tara:strand:- start:450 stop:1241 length:792 start_codon:yes stop_codon:yes gene_type:complete